MKRSNCLIFAIQRWMERGGYVVVRKSRHGWWPHFLWSQDLETFEWFGPTEHQQGLLFPPLFFRGRVYTGKD